MIDKKLGEKPIFFELSIGNAGNMIDGHNESSSQEDHDKINLLGIITYLLFYIMNYLCFTIVFCKPKHNRQRGLRILAKHDGGYKTNIQR